MRPTIFAAMCLALAAPTHALANDKPTKIEAPVINLEMTTELIKSIVSTQLIIYKFSLDKVETPKPKTLLSPQEYSAPSNEIVYPFLEINLKKIQKNP